MFEFLANWIRGIGGVILDTGTSVGLNMAAGMMDVLLAFVVLMAMWTVLKGIISSRGGRGLDAMKEFIEFLLIAAIFIGLLQRYSDIMSILRSLFEGIAGVVATTSAGASSPPLTDAISQSLKPLDDAITTIWTAARNLPGPSTGTMLDWLSPSRLGYLIFAPIAAILIWVVGAFLCFVFLSGSVLMGIAFGIGPLFITLGFFKPTRGFLDSWIKYVFSAGLVQYMVSFLAIVIKQLMGILPYLFSKIQPTGDPMGEFVSGMASSMVVVVVALIGAGIAWLARHQAEALVRGVGGMDLGAAMVGAATSVAATMAGGAMKGMGAGGGAAKASSAGGAGGAAAGSGASSGSGGGAAGGSAGGASQPAGAAGGASTPTVSPSYANASSAPPTAGAIPGAEGFGSLYSIGPNAGPRAASGSGGDTQWASFTPGTFGSSSAAGAAPSQGAGSAAGGESPSGAGAATSADAGASATSPSRTSDSAAAPAAITAPSSSASSNSTKPSKLAGALAGAVLAAPLAAVAGARGFMDGRTHTLRSDALKPGSKGSRGGDSAGGEAGGSEGRRRAGGAGGGGPNEAPGRPNAAGGNRSDRRSSAGAGSVNSAESGGASGGSAGGRSGAAAATSTVSSNAGAAPQTRPAARASAPPTPDHPPGPAAVPGPEHPSQPSAAGHGNNGQGQE